MAKQPKEATSKSETPFENEPSNLDEMTLFELRLMHQESSDAVLFAKGMQWRLVGGTLLIFGAMIVFGLFARIDPQFVKILAGTSILLSCGVIFILTMYQFWQFNEFAKMNEIETNFSTLYVKIRSKQSRRVSSYQRFTLLLSMIIAVVVGAVVANMGIR